jgi:hypothetical protein
LCYPEERRKTTENTEFHGGKKIVELTGLRVLRDLRGGFPKKNHEKVRRKKDVCGCRSKDQKMRMFPGEAGVRSG